MVLLVLEVLACLANIGCFIIVVAEKVGGLVTSKRKNPRREVREEVIDASEKK